MCGGKCFKHTTPCKKKAFYVIENKRTAVISRGGV